MKTHVMVLGVLRILVAFVALLFGLMMMSISRAIVADIFRIHAPESLSDGLFVLVASCLLVFSCLGFFAGIGLLAFRRWAWPLGIAMSVFDLLWVPVGTILGMYGLCVLLPKFTRRLFTPSAQAT